MKLTEIYEELITELTVNPNKFKKEFISRVEDEYYYEEGVDYDYDPTTINSGFCDIYADIVTKKLPGSEMWGSVDITPNLDGNGTHGHYFIKYKDKFYDAETPKGVEDYKDIPWFKRVFKLRGFYPDIELS